MLYQIISVFIGAVVAAQSRINGQMSIQIHSGIEGAFLSNFVGWVLLLVLVFGFAKERDGLKKVIAASKHRAIRFWELFGGVCGGFYLAMASIIVPQVGVAMFTIGTVGGQTVTSLLVDKIGLAPGGKRHITIVRLAGAITTLMAVTIAVYPKLTGTSLKVAPILVSVAVGIVVAFQQALNGRLNVISTRPLATALVNFSIGSIVLGISLAVSLIAGAKFVSPPHSPWIYLGGPLGVAFIAVSAFVVKHMGVLNFIMFSVAGQLVGALLLDWLVPTTKGAVNSYLIVGTVITLASITLSSLFETKSQIPKVLQD
jgi:transporter family-2 protein